MQLIRPSSSIHTPLNLPLLRACTTKQPVMTADYRIAKPHALFVALPYQGHFTPAVNLAVKIAAKGFVITFVVTEAFHHQRVDSGASPASLHGDDVFGDARSKGLDIRYELVSDGLPLSLNRRLHLEQFSYAFFYMLSGHVEDLLRKLMAGDPPISVLIADTFFVWPSTLAKKFGMPYVSFWTQPALVFSLYYHMPLLIQNGHMTEAEKRKDTITYVPGVPAIEPKDLVSFLQAPQSSSRTLKTIRKAFEEAKGADFVLCNTVEELEADAIAALQRDRPFYAIGPAATPGADNYAGGDAGLSTSILPELDCSQWLDSKQRRSVLYVSFGSLLQASMKDLEEIAHGVLDSAANFVWVHRPGLDLPLPEGFTEASRDRGMVVPWCRQTEVLMHPAVGGFLTHCGWNSVLESIWCGVPMLCFPLGTDQPTNRKLVVENIGCGIDLGGPGEVTRDRVSSKIRSLIGEEACETLSKKAEEVKKAVRSAVAPHGSSINNLDRFIRDLLSHLSQEAAKQAPTDTPTGR